MTRAPPSLDDSRTELPRSWIWHIRPSLPIGVLRAVLAAASIALCAACARVPSTQLAFAVGRNGIAVGRPLPCNTEATIEDADAIALPLLGPEFRVLSWNLHKNDDPGWDADLARFAAASDLLLIQESTLTTQLQDVLQEAGYDWLLASSFMLHDHATGVLSAARARPASACIQRFVEPLLRLPKAAVITRYEMKGVAQRLAVANVHSINFTFGLAGYRAQLEAITRELAADRGPVIVAGDLNTWSAARLAIVDDVMRRLGLVAVPLGVDTRSRFLGRQVDHIFVRGLVVVHAEVPEVASSDHNPVLVALRVE